MSPGVLNFIFVGIFSVNTWNDISEKGTGYNNFSISEESDNIFDINVFTTDKKNVNQHFGKKFLILWYAGNELQSGL